jgi:hypothetical protein
VGDDGSVRKNGVVLVLGSAILLGIGVLAFLTQGPPREPPPPPSAVAKVADVASTPRAVEVVIQRGADRVLQRERTGFARCRAGTMGCPGAIELRPVTVFLVQDEIGVLHAFIGEDPRNGCALEWMQLPPPNNWFIDGARVDAVFHDVCHGSLYDRRGRRVGGPSPFDLNALSTEERGADLYVDPAKIIVGPCPGCSR